MFHCPTNVSSRAIRVLLLFLLGCAPYSRLPVVERKDFASSELERVWSGEEQLYRTEIELYGNYFTGLTVFKRSAPRRYRVVFMSEMGVKFFDMSFREDSFALEHSFDKIDRKVVTKRIRKAFRLLLMPSIGDDQEGELLEGGAGKLWSFDGGRDGRYYYHMKEGRLEKAEVVDGLMKKKELVMRLVWADRKKVLERIEFEHLDVDLKWSLRRLEDR